MHRTSLARQPVTCRVHGPVYLLVALLGLIGPLVHQADAGRISSATARGLAMTVDARWTPGPAYRHVHIEFYPTAPATVDRTLTVEFLTRKTLERDVEAYDQRVVQDIEIPAGSGPVGMDMAIPQCMGGYYEVVVLEDRRVIKGLTQKWTPDGENVWTFNNDVGGIVVEQAPHVLIVGQKMPDLKTMRPPLLDLIGIAEPSMAELVRNFRDQEVPIAQLRGLQELPGRWIDYSNYDLLILSFDQFKQLSVQNPPAREAILRWAEAGGNLLVYGLGADWQRLPELERLASLAPVSGSLDLDAVKRRWLTPDRETAVSRIEDAVTGPGGAAARLGRGVAGMPATVPAPGTPGAMPLGRPGGFGAYVPSGAANQEPSPIPLPDEPSAAQLLAGMSIVLEGKSPKELNKLAAMLALPTGPPHFLYHRLGMGTIVALAPADPFAGQTIQWQWVYHTLGPDRLLWAHRHGVSMLAPNPRYWDFLIPGVGLPPVNAFRVLISLFVVVIGPVNYFLLRHWRRLYLLVVTVPATAAVITTLLLAYAFVADGMGTRVRARSFTWLDQRSGEAVSWARLSYYAGLTPSRGLTFSPDTVVLPLEHTPPRVYDVGSLAPQREMLWEGHQRLAHGWLPARTPTQLITVGVHPSRRSLDITADAQEPGTIQVENHLETRVRQLLVRTEGNRYYWAEDIPAGKTVTAGVIDPREAITRLRQLARKYKPEAPPGISPQSIQYQAIRGYRTDWSIGTALGASSQPNGRLEESLAIVDPIEDRDTPRLEANSYLSIVDASPEVELGLPDASEEASFHVILGTW